ncbi:MAG: hypothetical protein WCN98_00300 [Verrucomicrobiaceae bacterium]
MKPREKTLLIIFLALFAVIAGGGLLALSLKSYLSIKSDNETFQLRVANMKASIAQGAQWQKRSDWLHANAPTWASREEASSKLLDVIQTEAQAAGLVLGNRELVKDPKTPEGDAAPHYFNQTSVKLTINSVTEKQLFTWLHALQKPTCFLGVTRLQITPLADTKTVNCEAQITHFYLESPATPRLTEFNNP